ncbi:uncharacterized protein LOC112599081 [Melanaphis sacchari]|uniref:uncharacterized protein LOC112599081 n=1 Tax=Melanaphis sacchari TaxID=742174 RepID=UPI000DC15850|nr:uncharacterized protein LOC112599081 [Melanaphis sacchari]XP_025201589.1 uncharacterized protein LOC112599081 [Melanaphis sacchari]
MDREHFLSIRRMKMNFHHATLIFLLVCCCGVVDRTVQANIISGRYYGPHHHRIDRGCLYGTAGAYHQGRQQYRNIGLIGNGIGGSLPSLTQLPAASASIATTATVAMPRYNYNRGLLPYKNVIIPMSPYYWSPIKSKLLHRNNEHYRDCGSVSAIGRQKQQLFGGLVPKKIRKVVIDGPGGHVFQSFIRPNTHYGTTEFTVKR